MKDKTLHMIGNAHIDPVWLWRWQEGFHEVRASFRSALDRMKENEDFIFVSSSAVFYEWVEKSDPAMFEEIRARVAEGRWEIVGGWWLQPDCNLPSGESFVRQALYGQRYFQEKFGVTATVGYNVDSFGHHAMLPQLLKKSGLDYYVFMRPSPHEKGLPSRLFWWESDDGSRVLTYRIPFEYCTWCKDLEKHIRRCAGELREPVNELMCFYGVGNHGGGPTKENLESIRRLNDNPDFPKLVFSSPERYFHEVESKGWNLPVIHDELQHHASGCYAAHSGIKRWNRRAENLLVSAEKWATVAQLVTGQPYPNDLAHAWKGVLFNQFHDILAGTSLETAYDDARDLYGEALAIGARAQNYALQALAWNLNIAEQEGVKPIVVFNPHAWEVTRTVELESGRLKANEILLDEKGDAVPLQSVQSEATAGGRARLTFKATLPPLGYRTYRLTPQPEPVPHTFPTVQASDNVLENELTRLEFDPETGGIASLRDKEHELEVFAGPAATAVVLEDDSDTWSHNVFAFDKVVGGFKARRLKLVEHGPVKSVVRVFSEYGASSLTQDFTMYPGSRQIDVAASVNWQEQHKALKLRFPVNVHFMRATFEIPYGHIERFANGEEEPGQSWVDLSGTSRDSGELYGFSLLNDGKYSFDVNVRDIGLTVLRSPIYAHHDPMVPEKDGHYSYIDQGVQTFRYSLLPHAGSWLEAETVERAAELGTPPEALFATFHDGPLPQRDSFLQVASGSVVATVLKRAEDGDGLILRLYETSKNAAEARISLPFLEREFQADFGPCELKTFRIPLDKDIAVTETNLLELPYGEG
ncbi:alpha-mannosidase [soil metagenome]